MQWSSLLTLATLAIISFSVPFSLSLSSLSGCLVLGRTLFFHGASHPLKPWDCITRYARETREEVSHSITVAWRRKEKKKKKKNKTNGAWGKEWDARSKETIVSHTWWWYSARGGWEGNCKSSEASSIEWTWVAEWLGEMAGRKKALIQSTVYCRLLWARVLTLLMVWARKRGREASKTGLMDMQVALHWVRVKKGDDSIKQYHQLAYH